MELQWNDEKLKRNLENLAYLRRNYDKKEAQKISQRLQELSSADSYADLPPNTCKHSIKDGNKFVCFAVDIPCLGGGRGKYRMRFVPVGEYDMSNQKTIRRIKIIDIVDYH